MNAGVSTLQVDAQSGRLCRWSSCVSGTQREWLYAAGLPTQTFVMSPFASRIADGRFNSDGQLVALPGNVPGEPHVMHGFAWQKEWQRLSVTDSHLQLECRVKSGAWPWAHRTRVEIELEERLLRLRITLHNDSDTVMPGGIGLHPFFTRTAGAMLSAPVAQQWLLDQTGIPQAPYVRPTNGGELDRVLLRSTPMDAVYSGWAGQAQLWWPEWQASLTIFSATPHLVVYNPITQPFFCVEPVSNVPDAVNLPESLRSQGTQFLAAGGQHQIQIALQLDWSG